MRISFYLLLGVCWVNVSFAQTFVPVPGPLLQKEVQFEQANECYIHFNNLSGDSLRLHWRLVESNLPDTWDVDLCDYGTCYIGIPPNALMNPVYDTIQPYIKLIVQPGTNPGATWIWFRVYEEGNPDNFQDVFYSLHTPGTLGTSSVETAAMQVYPNPAKELLHLVNKQGFDFPITIRQMNGAQMWQGLLPGNSNQSISLSNWPSGMYYMDNGHQIQKLLIHH